MYKYIKDPIYEESLKFNKNQIKLIDNRIFKRLKNIKQLGSLYEVFPGACHTRAEHSLGVAYLSEKFLNKLEFNSNIKMDDKLVNNIKIAGLFHDVGHGPFSHVFDNHELSKLCPNSKYRHHEIRSIMLLENILTECNFQNMTGYDIDFIKNCIDPKYNIRDFKFQIIANKINSIDVDKLDYLLRDPYHIGFNYGFDYNRLINKTKLIDDQLFYHKSVANNIFDMFYTRYKFHRTLYNHRAVKSIELMIADILVHSDEIFNYKDMISNNDFIELDDSIITRIKYNNNKCLDKSKDLINRISKRNLYKEIYRENDGNLAEIKDNILDKYKDKKINDFHFITMNFDLCNSSKSPLENINFYTNNKTKINVNKLDVYKIIPNNFKESIVSVYEK